MSSDNVALKVENVSKCYEMYAAPHHRLLQTLFRGHKQFYKEFWALKDISFQIKKGECLGIIGQNGSGKSTLLQIIAGTLSSTTGSIALKGRVAALLELGSGFNPEFSGRENVYMNASILGLSRSEIDSRYNDIVAFADIGDFLDQPVKTYSSGMMVRLAFAVSTSISPDVLIIDEALAVGDMKFQVKCFDRLKSFRAAGGSVLFVSHDLNTVNTFCDKTCYLQHGEIVEIGESRMVTTRFYNDMFNRNIKGSQNIGSVEPEPKNELEKDSIVDMLPSEGMSPVSFTIPPPTAEKIQAALTRSIELGDGVVRILEYGLYDEQGQKVNESTPEQRYILHVRILATQDVTDCSIGYLLRDKAGRHIYCTSTYLSTCTDGKLRKGDILDVYFQMRIPLINHPYLIGLGLAERDGHYFEFINDCIQVAAKSYQEAYGNSWIQVENQTLLGKKWKF